MRARNIKPGFFKNEYLAECDPLARILFAGLWCMADKEGFLEYRPKKIKIEILPYDSSNIEKLLEQLRTAHVIVFWYQKTSEVYKNETPPIFIEIVNFKKHQNPHKNEKDSEIKKLINDPEISGNYVKLLEEHSTTRADSLSLIPDILIPEIPPLPPAGVESDSTIKPKKYSDTFENWWKEYPNKKGKEAAFKSWKKVYKSETVSPNELIDAIKAQVNADHFRGQNGHGQFIPLPATWLNQGRWQDEIVDKKTKCFASSRNSNDQFVPKSPIIDGNPYV